METLGFILFGAVFIGAGWLLVRYLKRLQDTADRRYSESTDDGTKGGGGY
jgi:hypothetical protein